MEHADQGNRGNRTTRRTALKAATGAAALLGASGGSVAAQAATPTAAGASLYHRLGGFDAIAAVTADFVGRVVADPRIGDFFKGLNTHSKQVLQERILDFLVANTGGPVTYVGEDMKTAHAGLHITENDFAVFLSLGGESLDKFHVPAKEKAEVVAFLTSFKPAIVGG